MHKYEKNFEKYTGDIESLGVHRNMRGCNFDLKDQSGNRQYGFVSHFVDRDLRVEIFFEKEVAVENRGTGFVGDIGTSSMEVEETFMFNIIIIKKPVN